MSLAIITRADFQELADVRVAEAKVLLDHGLWDGAYYLAGYAVELALKACIIKVILATDAFPEKKFSENCWTHDLGKLIGLAGLGEARKAAFQADLALEVNWGTLNEWSEQVRYRQRTTRVEARSLYNAISDASHGVLTWIKTQW